MRRTGIARWGGPMTIDRDFQRHHRSRNRLADFWPRPAVDDAGRQVQQQIDQPRRLIAAEQIAQQLVLLRPDAWKGRDRRKQRIEQSRAHHGYLSAFLTVMPGLVPGIHVFFCGQDVDGRVIGERKRRRPWDGYARP